MIVFELSNKFWPANKFISYINGKKFTRMGFGWFFITIWKGSLQDFYEWSKKDTSVWIDTSYKYRKRG